MGKIIAEWGKYYKAEYLSNGQDIDQSSFENKFQDLLNYVKEITIDDESNEIIFKKPCDFIVNESDINDILKNLSVLSEKESHQIYRNWYETQEVRERYPRNFFNIVRTITIYKQSIRHIFIHFALIQISCTSSVQFVFQIFL